MAAIDWQINKLAEWRESLEQKAKDIEQKKGELRERIREVRQQEKELQQYEVRLEQKNAKIRERERVVANTMQELGMIPPWPEHVTKEDVIKLYKRWRNYPKVAKRLGLIEEKVREIIREHRSLERLGPVRLPKESTGDRGLRPIVEI